MEYKTILANIGQHLNERKGIILKRNAMIFGVLILVGIFGGLVRTLIEEGIITGIGFDSPFSVFALGVYILSIVAAFLMLYLQFVFSIERDIWIDSYFDGRNLAPAQSWAIAKKLAMPAFKLYAYLFGRYVLPLLLLLALIYLALIFPLQFFDENVKTVLGGVMVGGFLFALVGWVVLVVNVSLNKLRYIAFAFLDEVGGANYSHASVVEISAELSRVGKSEAFGKVLMTNIGAATADGISHMVISSFGSLPGVRSIPLVGAFLNMNAKTFVSLARTVSYYLLYREAREFKYGKSQKTNEHLYALGG